AITGTPTTAGTYSFAVQVTSAGLRDAHELTLAIGHAAPRITTTTLPDAVVGSAYQHGLVASGGDGTYTRTITSAPLPARPRLDGVTGTLSGTPTAPGTAQFAVAVASAGHMDAHDLSITVLPTATAPVITTTTLPGGSVGVAYDQTLSASGGNGRFTWALA